MTTWTKDQILEKAEIEGFDYFFTEYVNPKDIEDRDIREAAEDYIFASNNLKELIGYD